jgi:hypothetical protein
LYNNIKGDIYFAQNNIKAAKEHFRRIDDRVLSLQSQTLTPDATYLGD